MFVLPRFRSSFGKHMDRKKDKFPCSLFDFLNLKPRGIPLTMVFRTVYIISFEFCHPSSKLLEGNVSTRACLFSGRERDAITHDAFDLTVQGLPVLVPASGGIWWSQLGTCLNLFTLGPYGTDIWCWLLKHVQVPQAEGTHPTGILSCFSTV